MVEEFAFDNADERRKVRHNGTGWIEVIAGSMFSGKSEELIRRLNRARIARQKVQVFKPGIDARYSFEEIASHSGQKHVSIPVSTTAEMMSQVHEDTQVVGIDEGQLGIEIRVVAREVATEEGGVGCKDGGDGQAEVGDARDGDASHPLMEMRQDRTAIGDAYQFAEEFGGGEAEGSDVVYFAVVVVGGNAVVFPQ